MTKITINRTFDPSGVFKTDAGKQLKDFIDSMLSVNELVLRTLRKGISFGDNVYCDVKDIEIPHNTPQVISASKPVDMILVGRVFNQAYPLSAPIHWYYDDQGQLTVIAQFSGTPTVAIKMRIVLLFS